MPSLAIIADDLTGALDAAAAFADAGKRVVVATRIEGLDQALNSGADVVAVTTRSREIAAVAARDAVARVVGALPLNLRVFKKIDSRLKGNIAAELAAFGDVPFLVQPAIPDFGRLVTDGAVTGFGVTDPIMVREALGRANLRAVVPDAKCQSDIDDAVTADDKASVLVGARGLAQALAKSFGPPHRQDLPPLAAPIVFAVGSIDPITLSQVAELRRSCAALVYLPAPSGELVATVQSGAVTLVQTVAGPPRSARSVADAFARSVAPIAGTAKTVVVTGGATAEALLDEMGVRCLDLLGDVLPGLPLCRAGKRLYITKSGGFGAPDNFVRLAAAATPPAERHVQEKV